MSNGHLRLKLRAHYYYTETLIDKIQEEDICDNRPSSTILYKARSNTLPLNNRNRHKNKETHCIACGNIDQQEDIYHFILHCPAYIKKRTNIIQLNTYKMTQK